MNKYEWYYQINFDKGYIVCNSKELPKFVKKYGNEIINITTRYEYKGKVEVMDKFLLGFILGALLVFIFKLILNFL